jgi:hypothetical protein
MVLSLMVLLGAVDPALQASLQHALTRSSATVSVRSWDAPKCQGRYLPAPFETSGRVAVRVRGQGCDAWGWAEVTVMIPVVTLKRDVRANEALQDACKVETGEAHFGVMTDLPSGAVAARALKAGHALSEADVRVGPPLGTVITVRLVSGAISVEQRATVSPCSGPNVCATLQSGKRVSGRWADGTLVIAGGP